MSSDWRPKRIISGGQTGADRGGLDAAMELGIEMGGWCAKGRRSEDGTISLKYDLKEHDDPGYPPRTRANVKDSQATIIFTQGPPTGGSKMTVNTCVFMERDYLVVDLRESDNHALSEKVRTWLKARGVDVLNIAGSRESKVPGIQARTCAILVAALSEG